MLWAGWNLWELSHHPPVQAGLGQSQRGRDWIQAGLGPLQEMKAQSQLFFLLFKKSFLCLVLQTWPQNCPSCCHPAQGGFLAQIWEFFLLVVYIYLKPLEAITHTEIFSCRHFAPLNSISILWCCLQQNQKSIPP